MYSDRGKGRGRDCQGHSENIYWLETNHWGFFPPFFWWCVLFCFTEGFVFFFSSPYYMKWSLSGCNFYFLVPSAPVAFGLNVYDRWTGPCLHHLVYNPSVCIYAMLGSGTGPMGIFISADFLSASIVLLQHPLSLMDLAFCWAHLQNIVPDSCQISCCRLVFFPFSPSSFPPSPQHSCQL